MDDSLRLSRSRSAIAFGVAILLAVAVAWAVGRLIGWPAVFAMVTRIPASAWLAFTGLLSLSYAGRLARVFLMLREIHAPIPLSRASAVFFVHNAVSTFVPARLGETALPLLARRWAGADWAATIGVLAWWRLGDTAVVAGLVLALLAGGARTLAPLYAFALAACALPLVVFWLRGALLRQLDRRDPAGHPHPRWANLARRMLSGMPAHAKAVAGDLVLALCAWSAKIGALVVLLQAALEVAHIAPLPTAAHLAAAGLAGDTAGALPLPALGGIGPFEAGVVLGLDALGIQPAPALATAVLLHGALLASVVITGCAGLLLGVLLEHERAHLRA